MRIFFVPNNNIHNNPELLRVVLNDVFYKMQNNKNIKNNKIDIMVIDKDILNI